MEFDREVVQSVAQECRAWLSNSKRVGLALASGKLGAALIEPLPGMLLEPHGAQEISVAIVRDTRSKSWSEARPVDSYGTGLYSEAGHVSFDDLGMAVFGERGIEAGPLIVVSRREIERAQKMALAFRLPESVALRWPQMRSSFSVDVHLMLVMPGKQWSPEKWRILWNGSERWAVKGSPNRSTFYDAYAKRTETLTQDEIAARMQALNSGN